MTYSITYINFSTYKKRAAVSALHTPYTIQFNQRLYVIA